MPDIASVNAGEAATLSDLCEMIERASFEERCRLAQLIMSTAYSAPVRFTEDPPTPGSVILSCETSSHEDARRIVELLADEESGE